jgi:hypothetical protein
MTRYRRIERDPDDCVKPWPFLGQLACAGVGLVMIALFILRLAAGGP